MGTGTENENGTGDGEPSLGEPLYDNDEEIASYCREMAAASKKSLRRHADALGVSFPDSEPSSGVPDLKGYSPRGLDMPDGAMMSRPPPAVVETKEEEEEGDEEVVFHNLPQLTCTLHTGNEKILMELSDTAKSVLNEVVKLIHSYLSESLCAAVFTPSLLSLPSLILLQSSFLLS